MTNNPGDSSVRLGQLDAAPAEQPQPNNGGRPNQTQTVNLPNAGGLPPESWWGKAANLSSVAVITIAFLFYMYTTRQDNKDSNKERLEETKASNKERKDDSTTAHRIFLEDAEKTRVQMQRQWDEVRKQGEVNQKALVLGTELQKDIRDHQRQLEASMRNNAELVVEVKKAMADATVVNKEILLELKKLNKERP